MLTQRNHGVRRYATLGRYPDLSLANAREKARDVLAAARLKKDEPVSLTFAAARDQFLKLHVPTMRPGTQKECTRILSTRFKAIERRRLTELKTSELATILDGIEAPAEQRNAFVWLRAFLTWSYQRGFLDQNPISRLRAPNRSKPRERVLSEEELVKVWVAASEGDFGAFIRVLILSGQRRGQWQQFRRDFIHGDTIVFPSEIMKGGKVHTIPLTPFLERTLGNHSFKEWKNQNPKRKLDKTSGVGGWTLHDLRRTFATKLAELAVAPHVIERLLAHQSGVVSGIAAVYNRASYLSEMRAAMLSWETRLQTLLQSTEGTNGRGDVREVRTA
jgi:integrase